MLSELGYYDVDWAYVQEDMEREARVFRLGEKEKAAYCVSGLENFLRYFKELSPESQKSTVSRCESMLESYGIFVNAG